MMTVAWKSACDYGSGLSLEVNFSFDLGPVMKTAVVRQEIGSYKLEYLSNQT